MSYTPFLIAQSATGLDQSVQPWVLPDDAYTELINGFVYRGVTEKRNGYSGYAIGKIIYTESRMIHTISAVSPATGVINGTNRVFTFTLHANVQRGGLTITGSNPSQVMTDNGLGAFTGAGVGTINYTTGAVSITFTTAPAMASTVLATYNYHQLFPVLGVMNFFKADDSIELIVADTTYVNRYNPMTNRLDDITSTPYSGGKSNFWSWVNYNDSADDPRLLFVNYVDAIQQYNGTTVSKYVVGLTSLAVSAEAYGSGDGTAGPYTHTAANIPLKKNTIVITAGAQSATDNGVGGFGGDAFAGSVNYNTGEMSITFNANVTMSDPITVSYSYYTSQMDSCQQIFQLKDRLICVKTIEDGQLKSKRIRVSGVGINSDNFEDAVGAGVIDIPDDTNIFGADLNRDDLMIFTESSTWQLKYTNNDVQPFDLLRLDSTRGSRAPFGVKTYLNRTQAFSRRGMIMSDGYRVDRMDNKLPNFTFNNINQENFNLLFSGFQDEERDMYTMFPSPGAAQSDMILVTNYEEDNFSIYDIPLSCMGKYVESASVTWDDLAIYPDWDSMADVHSTWNSFSYQKGDPVSIGGGHNGEIWRLTDDEEEDYPVKVRAIDIATRTVTTDFSNYTIGDTVYFDDLLGVNGMNNTQFSIASKPDPYTIVLDEGIPISGIYDPSVPGEASRVIEFTATTKKFNPFIKDDKKLQVGWFYFYVDTSGTELRDYMSSDPQATLPCVIEVDVITNDRNIDNITTYKYQVNCTDNAMTNGSKKWCKIWINSTGKFLQFRLRNKQVGAKIKINGIMIGMRAVGKLV